jgi:hypothetical protein
MIALNTCRDPEQAVPAMAHAVTSRRSPSTAPVEHGQVRERGETNHGEMQLARSGLRDEHGE